MGLACNDSAALVTRADTARDRAPFKAGSPGQQLTVFLDPVMAMLPFAYTAGN